MLRTGAATAFERHASVEQPIRWPNGYGEMLELNQTAATGADREADAEPRTTRHRFAFGGVAFEILADEAVKWELPQTYARYVQRVSDASVIADVFCSVAVERVAPAATDGLLRLDTQPDGLRAHSTHFRADVTRVGASRYAATARLTQDPTAVAALLLALTCSVVQLAGGVATHATCIELGEDSDGVLRDFLAAHRRGDHEA